MIYKKNWAGVLGANVPKRHWFRVLKMIEGKTPKFKGGSLHIHEEEFVFGRGRSLHVYYVIGRNHKPVEIEIRKS